jgi:hypothetical protein
MSNFKTICKIRTDFNSKAPEMEIRENEKGRFLNGKIQWLDGKDMNGKQLYTWFYFVAGKPEIIELITKNPSAIFEVEGFLKNKNWQDKKTGEWKNRCEINLNKANIYSEKKPEIQHFQEKKENYQINWGDDEIPF